MSRTLINRLLRRWGFLAGEVAPDQSKELIGFAARHFAEDFPNPDRQGCPPAITLSELVNSGKLPKEELQGHLLTCSECFVQYGDYLAKRRRMESALSGLEAPVIRPRLSQVPVFALMLAGIALTLVALLLFTRRFENSTPTSHSNAEAIVKNSGPLEQRDLAPNIPSTERRKPSPNASPASQAGRNTVPATIESKVNIDLDTNEVVRDPEGAPHRLLVLQTQPNELTIKLPSGSPTGEYQITLKDPFGKTVRTRRSISNDGVTLRSVLNLTSVKPGEYLICLTRAAEVPECVPASVESPATPKKVEPRP